MANAFSKEGSITFAKEKLALSHVMIKETWYISGARIIFNSFSALSRFSLTFPVEKKK